MGTPASIATRKATSWPFRYSGLITGGVIREASGTRVVSGDQPPPAGGAAESGAPGM
jgi:hypothetical protein